MIDAELSSEDVERLRSIEAREVFADALVEQGDPRGELILIQLGGTTSPEVKQRENELLSRHRREWLSGFSRFVEPVLRRGFIEHLRVDLTMLTKGELERRQSTLLIDSLLKAPLACSVELVDLGGERTRAAQLAAFAHALSSAKLAITSLTVAPSQFRDEELELVLNALPGIREVSAVHNLLGFTTAKRLLTRGLTALELGRNRIGPAGGQVWLGTPRASEVTSLGLSNNGLTAESLSKGVAGLEKLERLDLSRNPLGDVGVKKLLAGALSSLRVLDLSHTELTDVGARALLEWSGLARLESLMLTGNALSAEVKAALPKKRRR